MSKASRVHDCTNVELNGQFVLVAASGGTMLRLHYAVLRSTRFTLALVVVLSVSGASKEKQHQGVEPSKPAFLEIHLADLGYRPTQDYHYPGTGIPRDITILNDDYNKRLTFIDDKTLVVYQSHYQPQNQKDGSPESRYMEAFFVNSQTGALIARKTWPTIKRRFLNERWDTQARILAVAGGFLVHAGNSLTLYSTGLEQKAQLPLEDGPRWAVTVAPLGRTIHLQRIYEDNQADGEWLAPDTLTKLRSQHEMAGITSASDQAVVDKLAHCLQLQSFGEPARNLYCDNPSRLGLPVFLNESEVLAVRYKGFTVWSTKGEMLWGHEGPVMTGSHNRSLNGNRFALWMSGDNDVFDQVKLPKGQTVIIVYDRDTRSRIFQMTVGSSTEVNGFELSADGSMLAVLLGDTVRLYKIP
jgi:hypothetical protein